MVSRAVPAPVAQIPNALTILRLALIPVFVALVLRSDGGHSWPVWPSYLAEFAPLLFR